MSRFPRSEPDIAALALVVTQGLGQASDDFPTPPVAVDEMQGRLDAYNAARSAAIGAELASGPGFDSRRAVSRQGSGRDRFGAPGPADVCRWEPMFRPSVPLPAPRSPASLHRTRFSMQRSMHLTDL